MDDASAFRSGAHISRPLSRLQNLVAVQIQTRFPANLQAWGIRRSPLTCCLSAPWPRPGGAFSFTCLRRGGKVGSHHLTVPRSKVRPAGSAPAPCYALIDRLAALAAATVSA